MRKTIAFAATLALAACNNARSDADDADVTATAETADASDVLEGEAPGFEAVAPGTYQVTRSGGEVDYIEIHPGLTFSRVDADGNATGGSIFEDHLRRLRALLLRDPELCDAVRAVLLGRPCPTSESFYRLRSAGVLTGRAEGEARLRCRLYATYLEHCLR